MISTLVTIAMVALLVEHGKSQQKHLQCEIPGGEGFSSFREQLDDLSSRVCSLTKMMEDYTEKSTKQENKLSQKLDEAMLKIENFEYLLGQMAENLVKADEDSNRRPSARPPAYGGNQRGTDRPTTARTIVPITTQGSGVDSRRTRVVQRMMDNGICGVYHSGSCFWLIDYSGDWFALRYWEEAIKHCKDKGAKPANIYDMQHFTKLLHYIRSISSSHTMMWIGMRIDIATEEVFYNDGSSAVFKNWARGYPQTWNNNEDLSRILLSVDTATSSTLNGMFNANPRNRVKRVLCEVSLPE